MFKIQDGRRFHGNDKFFFRKKCTVVIFDRVGYCYEAKRHSNGVNNKSKVLLQALPLTLTIIGHGQNGDLSDGTISAFYTTSSFIDGGQICVHVTRETTTTWHLFSGSWHLGGRKSNRFELEIVKKNAMKKGGFTEMHIKMRPLPWEATIKRFLRLC